MITQLIAWALVALAFWWLSGHDTKVTGENRSDDIIRRAIRCGLGLFLLAMLVALPGAVQSLVWMPLILALQALIWCGCLIELGARWFHRLVDPEDKRTFDPDKNLRELDLVASLINQGRREDAIQLCQSLKESGDVNVLTLETLMEHLGVKSDPVRRTRPLVEAGRLRSQGKFPEAATLLRSLLAENPANMDAAMMLMRLQAGDLHQPDQAAAVLASLEKQPHVSPAYVEFARRSIAEWSAGKPRSEAAPPQPESLEQLLAGGYWGSAIEILEQQVKEQPGDFEAQIKLAELYGRHCGDLPRAEKIVRRIETHPGFKPEQIQNARARFEEWRKSRPPRT